MWVGGYNYVSSAIYLTNDFIAVLQTTVTQFVLTIYIKGGLTFAIISLPCLPSNAETMSATTCL